MKLFTHFFRAREDGFKLQLFGTVHIILLAIFILGIVIISNRKLSLSNKKINRKFLRMMAIILLVDQIILYSWQIFSGYFAWDMSLPLYHCRITVWLLIIGILFERKLCKVIGLYWGFLGSIISMTLVDLYQFNFPHYTNFQFFIVHVLMGWIVFDFIFVKRYEISDRLNKKALIYTNLFNIMVLIVNLLMKSSYPEVNYGYMLALPGNKSWLINQALHPLLMIILFNIGMALLFYLKRIIENKLRIRWRI